MKKLVKFYRDFLWFRNHGHTLRSSYFLARNTL